MRCTLRALCRLCRDRRGATAIEYGMILTMIAIAIVAGLTALGNVTGAIWNDVATAVIRHGP